MSFRIEMYAPSLGYNLKMPHDQNLKLVEAAERVDIYKRFNPQATFYVFNNENNDCEYQTE